MTSAKKSEIRTSPLSLPMQNHPIYIKQPINMQYRYFTMSNLVSVVFFIFCYKLSSLLEIVPNISKNFEIRDKRYYSVILLRTKEYHLFFCQ